MAFGFHRHNPFPLFLAVGVSECPKRRWNVDMNRRRTTMEKGRAKKSFALFIWYLQLLHVNHDFQKETRAPCAFTD